MVEFPETAVAEWTAAAEAAEAPFRLAEKIAQEQEVERALEKLRVRHQAEVFFQQELNAETTPVLEMGTLAELVNSPTMTFPDDMIDGVLKDSGVCIVLGPASSGKSTIAMQMIHSLTTGEDWMGQTAKPLSGSFGVLSYDMDYRMLGATLNKYPDLDHSRVSLVQAYKQGNPLGTPKFRKQIADTWRANNTEVVFIDSFSASFFGHDQNDAGATMAHYRDLKQFALTEVGAKVLIVIVHSTDSNPDKARGSTVHHDVADSIVGVSVNPDQSRKIRMVKYRAAPGQFQMNPVIVSAPDSVTHLISLDPSAMTLAGLSVPAVINADMFDDVSTSEAPDISADISVDSDQEDML